jgi:actin-related protein 10
MWPHGMGRRESGWVSLWFCLSDPIRAIKTGGPEMMREDYDALTQIHIEKGGLYTHRLAEEAAGMAELLAEKMTNEPGSVQPETGLESSAPLPVHTADQDRGEVGIQIEDLLPGMAIGGGMRRKRGWNADMSVGDWSRLVKV